MKLNQSNQEPLSEAVFFILLSIHQAPKHGYAILKEVEFLSEGRVQLSTGTLYGAIKRLLEKNWIVQVLNQDEQKRTNRPRKQYALTFAGKQVLEMEISRMKALLTAAESVQDQGTVS